MNIGLVLSGGMAKGAYQIGALRSLTKFLPIQEIKYISCASVGVLNGYAFVTENLDCAEQMWRGLCDDNARFFINQILKSSILQQNIVNLFNPQKQIPSVFYCSLLDICHRTIIYKDLASVNNELIPLYLKASVAMPIYNKAVQVGDCSFFDGAMIDNIPVYPLLKHNLDYIICIYFDDTCYKFENRNFDNKIIKITFPCKNIVSQSVVFEQDKIQEMINEGYKRTTDLLSTFFRQGYDDLDFIYHSIELSNKNTCSSSIRITGDVLVTNLNKITQKLTRKKIL